MYSFCQLCVCVIEHFYYSSMHDHDKNYMLKKNLTLHLVKFKDGKLYSHGKFRNVKENKKTIMASKNIIHYNAFKIIFKICP